MLWCSHFAIPSAHHNSIDRKAFLALLGAISNPSPSVAAAHAGKAKHTMKNGVRSISIGLPIVPAGYDGTVYTCLRQRMVSHDMVPVLLLPKTVLRTTQTHTHTHHASLFEGSAGTGGQAAISTGIRAPCWKSGDA